MGGSGSGGWRNPSHARSEGAHAIARNLTAGDRIREKLTSGLALGTFLIELPAAETVSAIAMASFDFVVLDLEHSSVDMSRLQTLILAGHAADLPVIVRPWTEEPALLSKILDMGANGVMAPHVDSAERAQEIVNACKFSPTGQRGFSPLAAFDGLETPLEQLSQSVFVIVQVEGANALANAGAIAAIRGIDAVFVGPYDLALSMDLPPGSGEVLSAAEKVGADIPDDVALGIYIDDPTASGDWARRNFKLQCVSFDGRMFANGARAAAATARNSHQQSE